MLLVNAAVPEIAGLQDLQRNRFLAGGPEFEIARPEVARTATDKLEFEPDLESPEYYCSTNYYQ